MKNSQPNQQNYYKYETKQLSHSQHLKKCKKAFEQLHRNQVNIFTLHKRHIQKSDHQISSQKKSNQQMQTESCQYYSSNDRSNHGLPSIPSQQYLNPISRTGVANKNVNKKTNIEIIKKMLEINSNKNKDKNDKPYHSTNYNQINYRSQKMEVGNTERVLFGQSSEYRGMNKRNKISKLFDQSDHQIEFFKNSKNRNVYDQQSKRSKIKSELKKISESPDNFKSKSVQKQKAHPLVMIQDRMIKTQARGSSFSLTEYNFLSLQSYIKYIKSPEDIKELNINFNFTPLRKLTPNEAWKNLDIKNAKMIENLLHNLIIKEYPRC